MSQVTHMNESRHICTAQDFSSSINSISPRYFSASASVEFNIAVCCRVLQCVAVCCSVLQCVAVRPSTSSALDIFQPVPLQSSMSQCVAVCCSVFALCLQCVCSVFAVGLQRVAGCCRVFTVSCSVLQGVYGVFQCVAAFCSASVCSRMVVYCNVLQCIAVYCSLLLLRSKSVHGYLNPIVESRKSFIRALLRILAQSEHGSTKGLQAKIDLKSSKIRVNRTFSL